MQSNYRILVADDHSIVRTGLSLILKAAFEGISISQARDFEAALLLLDAGPFDLLLLDIDLPGGNSVSMIPRIKSSGATAKILIFSAYDEQTYASRYLRAGADGYLNKLSAEEDIVAAVRAVIENGAYRSPRLHQQEGGKDDNPLKVLSRREYEIMSLLVRGEGNLEIANLLDIQMSTVSTYKKRIFEKLDVGNLPGLIEIFRLYDES